MRWPCAALPLPSSLPSADNRVGTLDGKLAQLRKDGKERFKDGGNVTPLRANEG